MSAAARAAAPEVIDAVERARRAQVAWGALRPRARARYLRRARGLLVERMDEVVATIREETGKPRSEALAHEVLNVLNLIRDSERTAPRVLRRRRVGTGLILTKRAYKQYEPLGVIGVNSPYRLFSMTNRQGRSKTAAKLTPSWNMPWLVAPSPMKAAAT